MDRSFQGPGTLSENQPSLIGKNDSCVFAAWIFTNTRTKFLFQRRHKSYPALKNSNLFSIDIDIITTEQIQNMEEVARSFNAFAKQETAHRNFDITSEHILKDAIDTSRIICSRDRNRKEPDKSHFAELENGIRGFEISSTCFILGYWPPLRMLKQIPLKNKTTKSKTQYGRTFRTFCPSKVWKSIQKTEWLTWLSKISQNPIKSSCRGLYL